MTEVLPLPDRWAEYTSRQESIANDEEKKSAWTQNGHTNKPHIIVDKSESIDSRFYEKVDSRSGSPSSMISDTISISEFDPTIKNMTQSLCPQGKSIISGYLYKKGVKSKMWMKRWYTLSDYTLFCFKNPKDTQLLRAIPLPSFSVSVLTPDSKIRKKHGFKVYKKQLRTHYFAAETEAEMLDWVQEISSACNLLSGTDTASLASESTDLARSVSYTNNRNNRFRSTTDTKPSRSEFIRHGSLMLKSSQDDLCDQTDSSNSKLLIGTNTMAWRKDPNRGMIPDKLQKMSVDSGVLLKGQAYERERIITDVRKSASSFELRLLNENSETVPQPQIQQTQSKYAGFTENNLNENSKEDLVRIVLMLVNELNVTNTEKLRYKKRMEKHKSTLIDLKTSMVKIFDKMQSQLFIEQEKYSAAMRQIKQLEKQISNLEAPSKLGRDIFKLTPQLANEIDALDAKISKAQEALAEVKSTAYHGSFKDVIALSSNLEAQEQYDIHLSQLREFIVELNSKLPGYQFTKEEVTTHMKETSANIKSLHLSKTKLERTIENLRSSDDSVSSLEENSQERYEQQLMKIIENLHQEEKKFEQLATEDQMLIARLQQMDKQLQRDKQLEREIVNIEENQATLYHKILKTTELTKSHLLDLAEDRYKYEQEFYSLSSRSPNGMFPNLPQPTQFHSDYLKKSVNAMNHLKYKSILELGLFSTLLQELLEMESENMDQLISLVVGTRRLQTDYTPDIPLESTILSIVNPNSSHLARQLYSSKNFQSLLLI
ncbi:hypothetical protein LOD99_13772 [Oopsacas minuta]|uniref:PH domain-containing protein n=1 Tax=Oopsacas minuta TaxID=111878 RepID=A0AAV7KJE2_9METZ|nr:hypothetical protein LOD99_13772 [Oopsacas minuta]